LASYLLIGFWYKKPSATAASIKAFVVNRVGDFGFLLGMMTVFWMFGTIEFAKLFPMIAGKVGTGWEFLGYTWSALDLAGLLLFVGAMGKSAQFFLHTWLPDAMEGPTPVSALIHAATMVTAGVFMVCLLSPLYEHAPVASQFIAIIGGITAIFAATVGMMQNDIKRVIAYSTCSQLGYMFFAAGVGAYQPAMFHLFTHAFFKALLFLGAGSVIIGMHHDQDIRNMGGLRKYMPITWLTFLIGTLALVGTPFFSGFYSKEHIIEAAGEAGIWGSTYAYYATLIGVFVTSLYSFRLYFLVFHGKERFRDVKHDESHGHDEHHAHGGDPHESPWVVTLPLVLLAIPSIFAGIWFVDPLLFGGYFEGIVTVLPEHPAMATLAEHWTDWMAYAVHGFGTLPFWLVVAGAVVAWYMYLVNPALPAAIKKNCSFIYRILENKYYVDWFNEQVLSRGVRCLGTGLWKGADRGLIDGLVVNGSARVVGWVAAISRHIQSGYVYHYAFAMILGILALLSFFVLTVR
jgi:NADH-quinone oxidoreductase subunit L